MESTTSVSRFWSDGMDETLKTMWADGAPARIIGYEIGRSKNAVIGRAHRLGLALHCDSKREPPKVKRHRTKTKRPVPVATTQRLHFHKGKAPVVVAHAVYEGAHYEAPATRKTLLELAPHDCRWPCWNDGDPQFFCGAPQLDGKTYCPTHCAIAYAPTPGLVRQRVRYNEAVAA